MEEAESRLAERERLFDNAAVGDAVLHTCKRVLEVALSDHATSLDLQTHFGPAIADIIRVEVSPLDDALGAFTVDDGVLTLNEEDIARLMSFVLEDMREQIEGGNDRIDQAAIRETLEDTACLFALHELRHRTQGIGNLATVRMLKKIAGREEVAKFDIQADRDAALALASARTDRVGSKAFFEVYQRALFYSVQYFFKIYPANSNRPDKVCRIAALLFMLARLQIYLTVGKLGKGSPIGALSVSIAVDRQSLAVYETLNGNRALIAANDLSDWPNFLRNIEDGELEDALGQAMRIAIAIGLG